MSEPLVSIVVPVSNGARYLRESLDSILAQTYPRTEVLVMDDASSDATPSILSSYDGRLRVHRQAVNQGIYGNANDGIARAQGELVAVYHADDVYAPEIVERQVQYLEEHPPAGAVFCADVFIDPDGREFGRLELPPELRGGKPLEYGALLNALLIHKTRFLRTPSSMVRKAVYDQVGAYDEAFRNTADLELWLRIGRCHPIGIIDEHLFRYRRGHSSSSERYHRLRTEPERFFQIIDLELENGAARLVTPSALAAYQAHRDEDRLMRSVSHYVLGDRREARRLLSQARAGRLVASPQIQRARLLTLLVGLRLLVRLPRIELAANAFSLRWHAGARR